MPSSLHHGKAAARAWFHALPPPATGPLRVLDVGAGSGTYRKLLADAPFPVRWEAVEIWPPYVEAYQLRTLYDAVHVLDVRCFPWAGRGPYDVVVFGDVLEHMHRLNAVSVAAKALARARWVLISIPIRHPRVPGMRQGEWGGNPFEVHVDVDWDHATILATWPTAWRLDKHDPRNPNATRIGVYVIPGEVVSA